MLLREKGRDLTKSYDKSPYTHRKIQKARIIVKFICIYISTVMWEINLTLLF